MKSMERICFFYVLVFLSVFFFSCTGLKEITAGPKNIDRAIASKGIKSVEQLASFFLANNPKASRKEVVSLAQHYIKEADFEGINSDVAFVQMCLETGFLRFGGLVTADMHNYCGLGAIDAQNRGERFATPQQGVRAHIQHLHAYGTTTQLKGVLIDRRYKYVQPRGKAQDIHGLAGTWAADLSYGEKLESLIRQLELF